MNGTTRSSMRLLTVRHVTTYRYSQPVGLGEHRMMFRPRESHDLRLVKTKLDIVPQPADLRWLHDVFDNSVAIATFDDTTLELRFDSTVTLEHLEIALPDYKLEVGAQTYPFHYPEDERPDLLGALMCRYPGDAPGRLGGRLPVAIRVNRHHEPASVHDTWHQGAIHLRASQREGRAKSR